MVRFATSTRRGHSARRVPHRPRRLRIEKLESRVVLSAVLSGIGPEAAGAVANQNAVWQPDELPVPLAIQGPQRALGDPPPPQWIDTASLPGIRKTIVAGDPGGSPADSPANRVDPNLAASPFAGVGSLAITDLPFLYICTATAISPTHVLTAAHCLDTNDNGTIDVAPSDVEFNLHLGSDFSHVITASALFVHPDWTGFLNPSINDDVAIVELSSPLPAETPIYALNTDPFLGTETATLAGYGQSGDAINGYTVGAAFDVKRTGQNLADFFDVDDEGSGAPEVFQFDFDGGGLDFSGTPGLGNDIETTLGGGDSGGPAFIDDGAGGHKVFGINTHTFRFFASAPLFGSGGGGMIVSEYAAWINSIIGAAAGVTVIPTSGLVTTEAAGTASFDVVLNTQPAADVMIAVSSSNGLEGTPDTSSLTFTNTNWNTPQTVTVTGVDDALDDGDIGYTIILDPAVSTDSEYNGLDPDDVSVTNVDDELAPVPIETGVVTGVGSSGWTTVTLSQSYTSMVVVGGANYGAGDLPAVVRIQNASGNSFDVRADNPNGAPLSGVSVHYTVAEEGVYTVAEHGVKMEAHTFTSIVTDANNLWVGESRTYSNTYANPVVLGQVMSYNDTGFSAFWSSGSVRTDPPSTAALTVGKHVGEDPVTARANETIGYLVIETGGGTVGGREYVAALGADIVRGIDNAPPFTYPLGLSFTPQTATVSLAGMDGGDGGWAILYGANPVDSAGLNLAVDEDQNDAERSHSTEQIAYLLFGPAPAAGAGITVTPVAGLVTTEAGGSASFDVVLDAQPAADVTIGISSSNEAEGTVDLAELTFTTTDWNIPQTVTVTGVDDGVDDGDVGYTIILDPAVSADLDYDELDPTDVSATNQDDELAPVPIETGVVDGVSSAGWTTVTLSRSYTSMVVIGTANYGAGDDAALVRIQNASGNSFNVRVDNPNRAAISGVSVHYTVVEAGVYTVAQHGVNMEAYTFNSTVTDGKNSWVGQSRTYSNNYVNPVVLGQVMTYNDSNHSSFWSRGSVATDPPSATALTIGKHVGEDPVAPRANETLGYLVIEAGGGTLGGREYVAAVGADIVRGIDNAPPSTYALGLSFTPEAAVVALTGMDGNDGGWAILYGAAPVDATNLHLALDEDQYDAERSHTDEQVAYLVFGPAPTATPGVTVTPTAGLLTTEAGGTATFDLALTTQPTADVTVAISSSNDLEGTPDTTTLTFTSTDWNIPQTVTVTGVDDAVDDGDVGYTIVLDPAVSADLDYDGLDPADVSVTNVDDELTPISIETGVVTGVGSSGWTTVTLSQSYTSMVVIGSASYGAGDPPGVVRIQSASGNSFDVRVDNPSGAAVSGITVHYTVVEEGVYTVAEHGVNMEAHTVTSTVTDAKKSWVGQSQSYNNAYATPVVLGQVMTYNDAAFSVFWAGGATRSDPPSSGALLIGKHVGEDTVTTRANETIGYMVIEAGSGSIGALDYVAILGGETVQGFDDAPPFSYSLSGLASAATATVSQAGMNGGNGSWPLLYGSAPLTAGGVDLAVDEDQITDAERAHIAEQVAVLVFGTASAASASRENQPPAPNVLDATGVVFVTPARQQPALRAEQDRLPHVPLEHRRVAPAGNDSGALTRRPALIAGHELVDQALADLDMGPYTRGLTDEVIALLAAELD